jgi:hypothetical protein
VLDESLAAEATVGDPAEMDMEPKGAFRLLTPLLGPLMRRGTADQAGRRKRLDGGSNRLTASRPRPGGGLAAGVRASAWVMRRRCTVCAGARVVQHGTMVRHVLAIYQPKRTGRRAVREASAIAAEHGAQLTVATVTGLCGGRGCCAISPGRWERIVWEEALADVEVARSAASGERVHLAVIDGAGARAIADAAERMYCDLVVVPVARVSLRGGLVRALRRRTAVRVIGVRGR